MKTTITINDTTRTGIICLCIPFCVLWIDGYIFGTDLVCQKDWYFMPIVITSALFAFFGGLVGFSLLVEGEDNENRD